MKVWLTCHKCSEELGNGLLASYRVDIIDSHLHEFTCVKGHKNRYYLQTIKYQLIFESSFRALVEGYYLEAVLGFTASLERFFEFFCKFACHKHGLDAQEFKKIWKQVSNQSERQYGTFLFLYGIEEMHCFDYKLFEMDKQKTFRNDVIHKGYLPTEDETVDYGERVFKLIVAVSVGIARKDAEYFHRFAGTELGADHDFCRKNPDVMPMGISSLLGMTYDPNRLLEKDFRQELNSAKSKLLSLKQEALLGEQLRRTRERT